MKGAHLPAEVALQRGEDEDVFRIGVSRGAAEHALGVFPPELDILDHGEGWRIRDLETGEETADVDALVREGRVTVVHDYPVTALRDVLQGVLRNLVWSALITRLVVSGVRTPTDWRFAADHDELRLHDTEGRRRARLSYPDWWIVASQDRALRLADRMMEQTGLEALGVEDLVERRRGE